MDLIRKAILQKCPDYDFDRYRFKSGDVVKLDCGAVIVVRQSYLKSVWAYVHKRSLHYRNLGSADIPYDDLPYYKKGEFRHAPYKLNKTLKWQVGDIVEDPTYGTVGYLYEETEHQCFYMYVMECDNSYYTNTGIYIQNPYGGYVIAK